METVETNLPGFFARLKQHYIYRVVTVYALAAWVLIQLCNSIFPDFGLPQGAVRVLIVALLLGFPIVLVPAWMLIKPSNPANLSRWQKLRWKLGALLSIVALILVVVSGSFMWKLSERHAKAAAAAQPPAVPATGTFNPPADTLVVLPFTNLSGDPKQQYFSDGITEELTDALGEIPALSVVAWETASAYRDSHQISTEIGKALNVANLLQGSIRREGDQVRVTVELVNTTTGYQLWSAQYDETLKNIFAMQDRLTQAIAGALQIKFAGAQVAPTVNPEAYDWMLKGLAAMDRITAASFEEARQDFEQAIALDPNYADAHAGLARVYFDLSEVSTLPLKDALPKVRAEANQALALDPHNVNALVALGGADDSDNHVARAKQEYQQGLALDPSNAAAHLDYGTVLPLKPALAQSQEAALLDPRSVAAQLNLTADYLDLHDYPPALAAALTIVKLSPDYIDSAFALAFLYQQMHRDRDMVTAFDQVKPSTALDRQLVDAGRLTYQALLKPAVRPQALSALKKLRHTKLSPYAHGDLIQLYLALGEKTATLQLLSELCTSAPVGCSDLAINPIFQPLHGDPRFQKLAKKYTTVTLE